MRCLPLADQRVTIRYELKPFKAAGAVLVFLAAASAIGSTTFVYAQFAALARRISEAGTSFAATPTQTDRRLPAGTVLTVLVKSYPESATSEAAVRTLTAWLEASGHRVFYERVDLGAEGRRWRVLAGAYREHEYETASWDAARLKVAAPVLEARVISTASARRRK